MASSTPSALPPEIQQLSFLVAENNPALQRKIVDTLSSGGVKDCNAVSTGSEAWEALQKGANTGVVICSWNLPEIAGIEVLKRVRADKARQTQPTFIIMSSENSADAVKAAEQNGADCFLAKPFSAEDLIPKVLDGVENRKRAESKSSVLGDLEAQLIGTTIMVELMFDRYTSNVECEELARDKCVIRVNNNYGLGTRLTLRFAIGGDGDDFSNPLKGVVVKTERLPKEYGVFLMHVRFEGPLRETHGVRELLRMIGGGGGEQ